MSLAGRFRAAKSGDPGRSNFPFSFAARSFRASSGTRPSPLADSRAGPAAPTANAVEPVRIKLRRSISCAPTNACRLHGRSRSYRSGQASRVADAGTSVIRADEATAIFSQNYLSAPNGTSQPHAALPAGHSARQGTRAARSLARSRILVAAPAGGEPAAGTSPGWI